MSGRQGQAMKKAIILFGQLLATAFAVYGLWAWALLIWWLA